MVEAVQDRMEEQIGDMLEDAPVEEVEEEVEVVVEEASEVVEEVVVEEEKPEEVIEDVVEEEVVEEVVEDVVEEEVKPEDTTDELQLFRDRINQIAESAAKQGVLLDLDLPEDEAEEVVAPVTPVAAVPVVAAPVPVAAPVVAKAPQSYDDFPVLMEGVNFEKFIDSEEGFVSGMRNILSRQEQMITQRFMQSIPAIVHNQATQIVALQSAADKFYTANSDLDHVKATVGAVATQIETKHPDWTMNKVLEESAKTTRKLLRLPNPKGKVKGANPSFAKPGGSKQRNKPITQKSNLQKEIDELL